VSKPETAQNRYRADLREIRFLLFEQFRLGDMLGKEPFEAWGADEVSMVIDESYKFACEVLGPLHSSGDRAGCRLESGHVVTPAGFQEAWTALHDAGWKVIATDPSWGGQGAPTTVQAIVEEFLAGANTAFSMYAALTYGAAEVVEHFGTPAQQETYLRNLLHGTWAGTMCLTEPHAGSDVGASRTSATKRPDGSYSIKGTKMFISAGDHDLTENIIHLVLARVAGAPPGTKGLSLFLVPKRRPDGSPNDVTVGSIEHKMGINASSTCVLNFGDSDDCAGELLGGVENAGMSQMFQLMNAARISVGIQGVAVASSAFLNALEYARERKQGSSLDRWKDPLAPRVSILSHPDVRRMLIDMKSRVEGIRALILKLTHHIDCTRLLRGKDDSQALYHQGQVDLLVPLVKSYSSDQAFRVCETAIQTFGGVGYTKDFPVEQYCRDAKIFSIYEGTNHIQAMDLVGRKLMQRGSANLQDFLKDTAAFLAAHRDHAAIGPLVAELATAHEALSGTAMRLLSWFQSGKMALVPLAANRFLEMMSEVAIGWLLLDAARIAHEAAAKLPEGEAGAKDRAFYAGKVQAAAYFARNVLPNVKSHAEVLEREDTSAMDLPDGGFASI
jgi:hypothetical protein